LSNQYPEAKSVGLYLRHGWHVAVAYVIGFFIMLAVVGWHPDPDHRKNAQMFPGTTADIEDLPVNVRLQTIADKVGFSRKARFVLMNQSGA
jgi:hypothetical protein